MRNLRGTYVHRGDAARKRRQLKQALFAAGTILATVVVVQGRKPATANAAPAVTGSRSLFEIGGARKLRDELESAKGELTVAKARYERAEKIMQYSTKYGITAGLAGSVFDASLREGIDPELAFRLVRLESEFNPRAVSKVGALGLTQLMPSTAKMLDKKVVSREPVQSADESPVGFRYLRSLLDMFKGNVNLALLAYNRGEDAVWRDVRAGVDPGNGYDRWVMTDYKGKGLMQ
jgi:soluble lytic murein transglycosylase-like protein